ncbi:hypothetical protein ABK040_015929 [Willaertia magna]
MTSLLSLPDEIFGTISLFLDDKSFLTFQKVSKSIFESTNTFLFKQRLLNKFKYWNNYLEKLKINNNNTFSLQKMLQNEKTIKNLLNSSLSKYLIIGRGDDNYLSKIQQYCKELGLQNVDIHSTLQTNSIPSLQDLKNYHSILLVGDSCSLLDTSHANKMSENICSYLLNGYGGVVLTVFSNCSNVTGGFLGGVFEDFHPITPTLQTTTGVSNAYIKPNSLEYEDHFLMIGYENFHMRSGDHAHGYLYNKNEEFDDKTVECIARFTDVEKIPAIATRVLPLNLVEKYFPNLYSNYCYVNKDSYSNDGNKLTGRICVLNFFPVEGWAKMSEGSKLIVNALLYCSCLLKNN